MFEPSTFVPLLAAIGVVIVAATLLSGALDRSGIPSIAIFVVIGLLIGPTGVGLVDLPVDSGAFAAAATIGLTLVLFTDPLGLDRGLLRSHAHLAAIVLGPGTLLTGILTAAAARWLLDLPLPLAVILGAALASTDPLMIRSLLRRPRLPGAARIALTVESGLHHAVTVPPLLLATAFLASPAGQSAMPRAALGAFVIGPLVGLAAGWAGTRVLEAAGRWLSVRREYRPLYAVGIGLVGFVVAETIGASGLMAAFVAGLAVALLDVELGDDFREHGSPAADMVLLFLVAASGSAVVRQGVAGLSPAALAVAATALLVRPMALWLALRGSAVDPESRRYIVRFGPRGLGSLLLILVPVAAGVSSAEGLLPVVSLTMLLSIVIHGAMLIGWRRVLGAPARPGAAELITIAEYRRLVGNREPIRLLDVRTTKAFGDADLIAAGAVRIDPNRPVESAAALALPKHEWLISYCT